MRFSTFLAGAGAIAAVFAYACSSSDDTTPPSTSVPDASPVDSAPATTNDAGADFTAACASFANAFCQKLASCGTFSLQRRYTDMNACVTRETAECTTTYTAPDTNRTPADTATCAAGYTSAQCSDILANTVPAACLGHPGNRALGASCAVPAQCQSGFCVAPRGAACGTCAAAGPAVGDICPETCGIGQYCNRQSGQCTVLSKVGDPCDENLACAPGLTCSGASVVDGGITQGKCQTPATIAGAACDTSTSDGTGCATEDGLTCSKKVCVAAAVATTGEPCGATTPVLTLCAGGAQCNNGEGTTGTCIGPIPDGAACDTSTVANCLPGSICVGTASGGKVNGVCQIRSAAACN